MGALPGGIGKRAHGYWGFVRQEGAHLVLPQPGAPNHPDLPSPPLRSPATRPQQSIVQLHPNGSVLFHHRTPSKYAHRMDQPHGASTAITARATSGWGGRITSRFGLERAIEKDEQVGAALGGRCAQRFTC